jgi:hypothetical protein
LAQSLLCQNQSVFNLYFYLLRQLLHRASNHCCINHLAGIIPYHINWHIIIAIPSYTTSTHTSPSIQHILKFKTHSFISTNHKIRRAWPTLTYS